MKEYDLIFSLGANCSVPHNLRYRGLSHSFTNFLVSIGINPRDLRGILGHYKPEPLALMRNHTLEN